MPVDPSPPPAEPRAATWAGRISWAVLLLALAEVLIVAASLLRFTLPQTDDMCRAGMARTVGVMPYLKELYLHWSGRWAGVGLALVLGKMAAFRSIYPWVLAAAQLTLPVAIYALLSSVFADKLARRTRVILSLGFIAIHWSGLSELRDSYYWLTGTLENFLPVSCGLFILAGLIQAGRQPLSRWVIAALAALAVFTGGLHELYSVYLSSILIVGTASAFWVRSPGRRAWAIVTVAGAIGLAINVAAPGHAYRLGSNAPAHDFARLATSLRDWMRIGYHWIHDVKLLLATIVMVCHPQAAAACPDWLRRRRTAWATAAATATVGVLVSAAVANWWTTPGMLPGRTQSALYFLFLIGWFLTAFAVGTAPSLAARAGRPLWAALAVCFAVALVQGTNYRLVRDDLRSGRVTAFRRQVEERDRLLRTAVAAGDRNPSVPPIADVPRCVPYCEVSDDPNIDPAASINSHYCVYYDLESIHLRRTPAPLGPTARAADNSPVRR